MDKPPTGRVTSNQGARPPAASRVAGDPNDVQARPGRLNGRDSGPVRPGWIWGGFLALTLLAIGVAIVMGANHHGTLAIMWGVIAAGWFAISMWLWRQHSRYMRGD